MILWRIHVLQLQKLSLFFYCLHNFFSYLVLPSVFVEFTEFSQMFLAPLQVQSAVYHLLLLNIEEIYMIFHTKFQMGPCLCLHENYYYRQILLKVDDVPNLLFTQVCKFSSYLLMYELFFLIGYLFEDDMLNWVSIEIQKHSTILAKVSMWNEDLSLK